MGGFAVRSSLTSRELSSYLAACLGLMSIPEPLFIPRVDGGVGRAVSPMCQHWTGHLLVSGAYED